MYVQRRRTRIEIWAPAKLNLYLEVLGRRADGYHELETLMVPISLFDTLRLELRENEALSLDCRWAAGVGPTAPLGDLPAAADNLVYRAVALLRERAGVRLGLAMTLLKRIPSAAGLGGGSSDAAAALCGANLLWNLGWTASQLSEVAAELGSDIPFFFAHGPAICRGRGERVEPTQWHGPRDFVVLRPPQGLSTAQVYRRVAEHVRERPTAGSTTASPAASETRGTEPRRMLGWTTSDRTALDRVSGERQWSMHNRLQAAAEPLAPWLGALRDRFAELDVLAHQLSGSGSAYFAVCRDARHARRIAGIVGSRNEGQVFCVRSLSAAPPANLRASQN
jgi:4-diphosphocytidyl-2-C-methyl-D-erythritol kinase